LEAALVDDPNIDGVLPILFEVVPVINPGTGLSSPGANIVGLDAEKLAAFPDFVSISGDGVDIAALAENEVYVNKSLADEADIQPGDLIQVFVQNQPLEFTVADVVEDRVITGVFDFEQTEGLVTSLETVQRVLGREGEVNVIAISNSGGVRDGVELTDAVVASVERVIADEGLDLDVEPFKQDGVDHAERDGNFMVTFFLIFGLFSIAAGMLLILMIFVMLAAERKSELGMTRAIGAKRSQLIQTFLSEGMVYNLAAAAVGAALGVLVSFGMTQIMARIFSEFDLNIQPHITLRSVVVSYSLGVVLTFITVTFSSWRVSKLNIVRAIRDLPDPPGGRMGWRSLAAALAAIALGALLSVTGMSNNSAFPFALGFSLILSGAAIVLRFFRLPERPVFTAMGLLLLLLWGFVAGNRLEFLFGPLEGGPEMFFLSGVSMVTASTFVLIFNADIVLAVLSRIGARFGRILPAMKTAVAYPLANKFRTGMTLAMISLIVFALVMMSTMNLNFDRLFLGDEARGGWDVLVEENANNPLGGDLVAALEAEGSVDTSQFRSVGRLSLPGRFTFPEIRQLPEDEEIREVPEDEFDDYPVLGVSPDFVDGADIALEARDAEVDSDEAVWQQVRDGDNVALIDAFAIEGGFNFGPTFNLDGIPEGADVFDPVTIEVRDPVSGNTRQVSIIGVISFASSSAFFGVYIPERTFADVFGEAGSSQYYVGLESPDDAVSVANEVESALTTSGAQASSIKKNIDDDQALFRNFFRLMQSFMGLGLFVGIAAVGVISFRSVVERRQQIGMLRAIGYTRGTVALSFILESTFVAALGVLSGVGLAIWLSYFLITSDEFPTSESAYVIPWFQIALISAFAFFASLLMTIVPSRLAASVPIAEALRYE
jgi:putative ABC transport system permease protein